MGLRGRAAGAAAAFVLCAAPAFAQDATRAVADANDECLACHSDPELTRQLDDGSSVSLFVEVAYDALFTRGALVASRAGAAG